MHLRQKSIRILASTVALALSLYAQNLTAIAQDVPELRGALGQGDSAGNSFGGINVFEDEERDDLLAPTDSFSNRERLGEDDEAEDLQDSERDDDSADQRSPRRRRAQQPTTRSRAQPGLDPLRPRGVNRLPRRNTSNADAGLDPSLGTLRNPRPITPPPGGADGINIQPPLTQGLPAPPPPPAAPPGDAVDDADDDAFEPLGVRVGGLIIRPTLGIAGLVTDNVLEVEDGRESDIAGRLQPAIEIESDFIRHSFTLNGEGDLIFFEDESEEDEIEINTDARLSLDVRRNTQLDLFANWALTQTSSNSLDATTASTGERPDNFIGFGTTLAQTFNRLEVSVTADSQVAIFGDDDLAGGGTDDNDDRNFIEPGGTLRLGYELSPSLTPFIETQFSAREFFQSVDDDGLRRDSLGGSVEAGVEFDFSGIWTGSAGVVFLIRSPDDPTLETVEAFGLNADIIWRPQRPTTVNLNTSTSLNESGTLGVSQIRNYSTSLIIEHQLRRNLRLRNENGFFVSQFVGIGETEFDVESALRLTYSIRRGFEVYGEYELQYFDGADGLSTIENRFTLGVTLGL